MLQSLYESIKLQVMERKAQVQSTDNIIKIYDDELVLLRFLLTFNHEICEAQDFVITLFSEMHNVITQQVNQYSNVDNVIYFCFSQGLCETLGFYYFSRSTMVYHFDAAIDCKCTNSEMINSIKSC